ncbi:hypothetical protein FF38_04182 [Lucilia cuprina]|uniref:Reverse transcriptase/retrotransposon-derived protein RNase H-like domain-containing protein n=1 Tax=Lucilia cuprina TaxID=7375 RepID=A0A0L0BT87_LUCCU|nr:hypothetical protein FF38_04182 [Lucilia cuprina]
MIVKPMTKFLKKDAKLDINDPEYLSSFKKLKTLLTNIPILAYPDFNKKFVVNTDASNFALGAVLSQDNHRPFSRQSELLTSTNSGMGRCIFSSIFVWKEIHYTNGPPAIAVVVLY